MIMGGQLGILARTRPGAVMVYCTGDDADESTNGWREKRDESYGFPHFCSIFRRSHSCHCLVCHGDGAGQCFDHTR